MEKVCSNCAFILPFPQEMEHAAGYCRRQPPVVLSCPNPAGELPLMCSCFPEVPAHWSCGEFAARDQGPAGDPFTANLKAMIESKKAPK